MTKAVKSQEHRTFRSGDVEIDTAQRTVRQSGEIQRPRPRAFDLLVYLIERRQRVVPRQELQEVLWPGVVVTDNSVMQCVNEVRKALGDDSRNPRFIRTVSKAGYQFIAPLDDAAEPVAAEAKQPVPAAGRKMRWMGTAAAVLVAFIIGSLAGRAPAGPRFSDDTAAMTSNLKAARAYAAGVELARQYHMREAVENFQEALRLDPEFLMARARLGYVYSVRWLWEEQGKPYLESAYAARAQLNDLHRHYILAWYSQAHRDYHAAIRHYRELLARFPAETEAREELGRILIGEDRFAEARGELEQAIRLDPTATQARNLLASLFMATHEFGRAVEQAQLFVRMLPEEVNAQDTLGLAYEASNEFEKAEQIYRQILAREPGFEPARIHLANTLYRMGRWKESRRELERYVADAPSDAERHWGSEELATICLRQGDLAVAGRYTSMQPAEGYHDQAALLALKRGDLAEADRLLAARPEHADRGQRANRRFRLVVEGERSLAAGDQAGAIQRFERVAAERTPIYATEWYEDTLADAFRRVGRYEDAVREYRRVLKIYPRLAAAWSGLAATHAAMQQESAARAAYEKVLEIWAGADHDVPGVEAARKAMAGSVVASKNSK